MQPLCHLQRALRYKASARQLITVMCSKSNVWCVRNPLKNQRLHMQQAYVVYLHEKEDYAIHEFAGALHSSPYFLMDFDEPSQLLHFLKHIEAQPLPQWIIIDLDNKYNVQSILQKLSGIKSNVRIMVLCSTTTPDLQEDNICFYSRPTYAVNWQALVLFLML